VACGISASVLPISCLLRPAWPLSVVKPPRFRVVAKSSSVLELLECSSPVHHMHVLRAVCSFSKMSIQSFVLQSHGQALGKRSSQFGKYAGNVKIALHKWFQEQLSDSKTSKDAKRTETRVRPLISRGHNTSTLLWPQGDDTCDVLHRIRQK